MPVENKPSINWKEAILNFFKGAAVKAALIKILGSAALGGFRAWAVKFIVENLFNLIAEPIIELTIRKGLLILDKATGTIKIKKLERAKEEGNETNYNTTIDDI